MDQHRLITADDTTFTGDLADCWVEAAKWLGCTVQEAVESGFWSNGVFIGGPDERHAFRIEPAA